MPTRPRPTRNPLRSPRARALLATAGVLVGYGYGLLPRSDPAVTHLSRAQLAQYSFAFQLFGVRTWGWTWITVGVLVAVGALWVWDRAAYALATLLLSSWATFALAAYVHHPHSPYRPWLTGVIFLAFTGLVLNAAAWDERPAHAPTPMPQLHADPRAEEDPREDTYGDGGAGTG